jgi:hypothetical protein
MELSGDLRGRKAVNCQFSNLGEALTSSVTFGKALLMHPALITSSLRVAIIGPNSKVRCGSISFSLAESWSKMRSRSRSKLKSTASCVTNHFQNFCGDGFKLNIDPLYGKTWIGPLALESFFALTQPVGLGWYGSRRWRLGSCELAAIPSVSRKTGRPA